MSASKSDHNYYSLEHRQRTSLSSPFAPPTPSADDHLHHVSPNDNIPTLPAISYRNPTNPHPRRPLVSTTFEQYVSDASQNGFLTESPRTDNSPDPYEFYKQYRDPFRRESIEGYGQADIVVTGREDGMTASRPSQRPTPVSARSNGFAFSPLASRISNRSSHRSPTSPLAENPPLVGAKSSPQLASTARNRQTSLQDLVKKFNQTPDEVPPLPGKPASRSTSATRSPAASHGSGQYRSRTPSDSHQQAYRTATRLSFSSQDLSNKLAAPTYHKANGQDDVGIGMIKGKARREKHKDLSVASNSQTTQSMSDLSPPSESSIRQPLFGEVLSATSTRLDPGYGISESRPRRGSEGSMHTPNPMFPDDHTHIRANISPTSPTAWYLGVTPSLEGVNLDGPIPTRRPGMHRRSRSDFSSSSVRQYVASSLGKHIKILSPPQESLSPLTSPNPIKRTSQSRIPLSTRRLSITSDSGNSSPPTRTNSALDQSSGHRRFPAQAGNTLHKARSNPKTTGTEDQSKPCPSKRSPKRRNLSPHKHNLGTNPLLTAYISAPMPMKSPPLRSSRPRQPVSSATTAASRARVVERLTGNSDGGLGKNREHKPRHYPELGGVDFAARRQKIQQAFTKTVQENQRKEELEAEKKRVSLMMESQLIKDSPLRDLQEKGLQIPNAVPEQTEVLDADGFQGQDEDIYATPAEEMSREPRELTINTAHLLEKSILDLNQEDSPTLGAAHVFLHSNHVGGGSTTPDSDAEPLSAKTNDTVDTFFDNEPQAETPSPATEHRILLGNVTREPTPATPPSTILVIPTEESSSDQDDQESIQIMLGATPITEQPNLINTLRTDVVKNLPDNGANRWSGSSWTSSIRSKDRHSLDPDRDVPMERIGENSPLRRDQSAHASLSTTASSYPTQPWSPESASSMISARTTLDSDSYNTINRVLEHYHDPSLISPEAFSDFQQRSVTQSPNLARMGGWDPSRVTQLYLQNLARTKYAQTNALPEPLKLSNKGTTEQLSHAPLNDLTVPDEDDDEAKIPPQEPEDGVNAEYHQTPSHDTLEVAVTANLQRASLNRADDWANTSPSFLDWIHHHAADSPTEDKILPAFKKLTDTHNTDNHRAPSDSHPQLPEIQTTEGGLGINIHVESPHDEDSPNIKTNPTKADDSHTLPPPLLVANNSNRPVNSVDKLPTLGQDTYSRQHGSSADISAVPNKIAEGLAKAIRGKVPQQPDIGVAPASRSGSTSRSRKHSILDTPPPSMEDVAKTATASADQKRLVRRRHIIKELVDTEHSFGQDMKVVDDIYKGTSNGLVISDSDVKILFGNSDQIVAFSTSFLDALKQAAKSAYTLPKSRRWRSKRDSSATSASGFTDDQSSVNGVELGDDEKDRQTYIGEAFVNHMSHMEKVYSDYLKNHDAANQKLQALQKNDKVQVWLNECRTYAHDLTTAWDLDSLLVKPVQRILKYPLLLKELLEVTAENHPDFNALDVAAREMVGVSVRINEMKKRADILEQVAGGVRKRRDNDGRIGLKFGRRTEKIKQHIGLSETVRDREYEAVHEKYSSHFFQLQVIMRDVEMYTTEVQSFVSRFNDLVLAIEAWMDVGQSSYPEMESKWRRFRMSVREIQNTCLPDHTNAVRKNVIDPIMSLLGVYQGLQKLMQKREKREKDYTRYKALKDRGDKPDKKTTEQKDQFIALNDTLKEELPKLFLLTGKMMEACLNNYVQLQLQWQAVWRRKLSQAIDSQNVPIQLPEIIAAFAGDFQYTEAQVLSLGVCNGSLLNDAANLVNFLSPTTTLNGDENSPRQSSTATVDSRNRGMSQSSDIIPSLPQPDFGGRQNDSLGLSQLGGNMPHITAVSQSATAHRIRASSTTSARSPGTPDMPGSWRAYSTVTTPVNSHPDRPSTSTGRSNETPSLPRLSVDTPGFNRLSGDSQGVIRPNSTSTFYTAQRDAQPRSSSPPNRYSGFFSSALPMSDSPLVETPQETSSRRDFKILFLAASVYEFNIDRSRQEAGYPYLVYRAGEIFDVIGEKGELWLAKNQDDKEDEIKVGWIWNKHFAKLAN
ncbi:MAG: hypothetical protein Q9187_000375 [Circinaria calcarea]